ncbi:MAG: hypothetical protein V1865_00110 [bacterium]
MLEKQPIPKNYDQEDQAKEEKPSFFKKWFSLADLFGDMFKFASGKDEHGEEIREDIVNIEKHRRKEKERLAKEREIREKIARKKALAKKEQELLAQKTNREKIADRRSLELDLDKSVDHLIKQKTVPQSSGKDINFLENFNDDGIKFEQEDFKKPQQKEKKVEMTDHKFEEKEKTGFFAWLKNLFKSKPKAKKEPQPEIPASAVEPKSEAPQPPAVEKKPEPLKEINLEFTEPKEAPPVLDKKPEPSDDKEKATQHFLEERMKLAKDRVRSDVEERSWHSYNIVKANLIKDQQFVFFNWQRKILFLLLFMILAALVSAGVYGGLLVWDTQKKKDNQYIFDNLENINEQIVKEQENVDNILAFSDKLSLVGFILDNHIYWSEFFKFLEDYTLKSVYYERFNGNLSGEYKIPSVAKDFDSVYRQLKLMQLNEKVVSVDTEGAKTEAERGATAEEVAGNKKFIMNLSIDNKLFLKLNE